LPVNMWLSQAPVLAVRIRIFTPLFQ